MLDVEQGRKEGLGKSMELMIGGMELSCWGTQLPPPAPSPPPSAPWRPWEKQDEKEARGLKGWERKGRRKKRSPAAAARSRQRFLRWQEKLASFGQHRLQVEQRLTPQRGLRKVERTRLIARLEECASPLVSGEGTSGGRGETGRRPAWRGDSLTVSASNPKTNFSLRQSYVTPEVFGIPPTPPPSTGWVNAWPPGVLGGVPGVQMPPGLPGEVMLPPRLPGGGVFTPCTSCGAWGPTTPLY